MTSASFTGDLVTEGGLSDAVPAADALCRGAAVDAGLGGTWRAFIALDPESAMARHSPGAPYRLVGSLVQVFRSPSRLTQPPEVALNRTEFGTLISPTQVWTGTDLRGVNDGVHCDNWSSASPGLVGSVGYTADAGAWTGRDNVACDQRAHLYCFEY